MSVMPQQALALANSQLTVTLSRKIAREEFGAASEKSDVINRLFQRLLCRPATSQELTECREFVKEQTEKFRSLTASNESSPETDYSKPSKSPGIHALESLALVLYNHSDFVTVR